MINIILIIGMAYLIIALLIYAVITFHLATQKRNLSAKGQGLVILWPFAIVGAIIGIIFFVIVTIISLVYNLFINGKKEINRKVLPNVLASLRKDKEVSIELKISMLESWLYSHKQNVIYNLNIKGKNPIKMINEELEYYKGLKNDN